MHTSGIPESTPTQQNMAQMYDRDLTSPSISESHRDRQIPHLSTLFWSSSRILDALCLRVSKVQTSKNICPQPGAKCDFASFLAWPAAAAAARNRPPWAPRRPVAHLAPPGGCASFASDSLLVLDMSASIADLLLLSKGHDVQQSSAEH
jgi:hypothetical protein